MPLDGWNRDVGYERNFLAFLDGHAFATDPRPILLCFDRVVWVIFGTKISKDFFGSCLRSFFKYVLATTRASSGCDGGSRRPPSLPSSSRT